MATVFESTIRYVDRFVPLDSILPFFLIFTVFWYFLSKLDTFKDNEKVPAAIAIIISLLAVVPHIMGKYPKQVDPVLIINNAVPSVGVLGIAIVVLFILFGIIGKNAGAPMKGFLSFISLIVILYVFAASIWPSYKIFSFLSRIPREIVYLVVTILVLGLLIRWITGKAGRTEEDKKKGFLQGVENFFGRFGGNDED